MFNVTAIHALLPHIDKAVGGFNELTYPHFFRWLLISVLITSATLAVYGFKWNKKIHTLLSFLPQQFIMLIV